ncbi:MAG: membrane protein insertase YidC [Longimicrobiales bacterium]
MQNSRFLLAIVLAIGVILVTNLLFPPVRPTPPAAPPADTSAVRADTPAPGGEPAAPPEPTPAPVDPDPVAVVPAVEAEAATDTIIVRSPLYRYGLTTSGSIVRAELSRFESLTGVESDAPRPDVNLAPEGLPLVRHALQLADEPLELSLLELRADAADEVVLDSASEPRTIELVHAASDTAPIIRLRYTFDPRNYLIHVSGEVGGALERPLLLIRLGPRLATHEADTMEDRRAAAYVVNSRRDGINSVRFESVETQRIEEGPLYWAALRTKYFLVAAISPCEEGFDCFGGAIARPAAGFGAELTATMPIGADGRFAYDLYVGPQDPDRLAAIGRELQDVNPYGWRVFRPILTPLGHLITWAVVALHDALRIGYGWVLILFGILIQLILWPLNTRAMRSQLKNMELQPVIQEIQRKYKNDPERLQKEMVRLYREEGFNPLGGCLPMLIPFPVLITLFFVFQNTIEFRGADFLWLPDLSRPDPLYLLPVLLGLSMFGTQWLSARSMPQTSPQMKIMMWLMPGMIMIFFFNLASGLNLYYASSNLAALPRQVLMIRERKRHQQRPRPAASAAR